MKIKKMDAESFKQILNIGKVPVLTLVNDPEINSSSDMEKLFASIFASNASLNDIRYALPDIPQPTENNLKSIIITAMESQDIKKSWP